MSQNITIIGRMGTGKTTWIKRLINGKRSYIFDVNNEYPEYNRMTDLEHKLFLQRMLELKNTVGVFEDATGFIQGFLSDDMRKALVSKRHTGNTNVLVFHSVLSVPPRLLQLTDYVVLFKTNDEGYQVIKKYPSLWKTFEQVDKSKNKFFYKIIQL